MARWLCRLPLVEVAQASESLEAARCLGVAGWLVSLRIQSDGSMPLDEASSLFAIDAGLPVALELEITTSFHEEQLKQIIQDLLPWLLHPKAFRLSTRTLLFVRECLGLDSETSCCSMLRECFEQLGCSQIPLLFGLVGHSPNQFDGCYERVLLPNFSSIEHRVNYEIHLHDAHWRDSGVDWQIPAVRALSAEERSRYINANALRYREWLQHLSHWADLQRNGASDALVILESWAGHCDWWEPQSKAAFKIDQDTKVLPIQVRKWGQPVNHHVALFLHGYYLDGLAALLKRLRPEMSSGLDLYVSTPIWQLPAVVELLRRQSWPCVRLFGVPNRGRDLAPFILQLLPEALRHEHQAFIKLHTKSSPHLVDGGDWGEHLISSLINLEQLEALPSRLAQEPTLGLQAPAGTLVPMSLLLQNNGKHLLDLQRQSGWNGESILSSRFIAGSMFCGRLAALSPLLDLGLTLNSFEPESGQTDGTMAHAMERWIGMVVTQQGYFLEELPGDPHAVPEFGYRSRSND